MSFICMCHMRYFLFAVLVFIDHEYVMAEKSSFAFFV